MMSYCKCILKIKLNIKWYMVFLAKKSNLDIMDKMVQLTTLNRFENLKSYNKHVCFLTKHLGFLIKKIPVVDIKLKLNSI